MFRIVRHLLFHVGNPSCRANIMRFTEILLSFYAIPSITHGPVWLNELGSCITYQLIQAYHQYGVG
jgi:hypothetical protein